MADGLAQPILQETGAIGGNAVDVSPGTGPPLLGGRRCGESVFDEPVEGPVDQWSAHGEHPADRAIGVEFFGDGKAVSIALGENSEHGVLRCGELRVGERSHNETIYSLIVTRGGRFLSWIGAVVVVVSCSAASESEEVLVSAAASLTDLFTEMEQSYENGHPNVDVIVNFGGSSALREQIVEGAPVDVFASADLTNMEAVVGHGLVRSSPQVFALNEMTIAVSPGNPGGVVDVSDLSKDSLLVGLCADGVPCGDLAREILGNADVSPAVDSNEPDVRALLTKIELGELDVGLVYVTDVSSGEGGVQGISIPAGINVTTEYPIAVLAGADREAFDFVAWVLSSEGRSIIREHGFGLP